MKTIITIVVSVIAAIQCLAATTWYVAKSGNDSNTGKSESEAFLTIQKAVDSSTTGDSIIVDDGVYDAMRTGNKDITIKSKNGFAKTVIDGKDSVSCVAVGMNYGNTATKVIGFTIRNGHAPGNYNQGGGAYGGTLINCVLSNNYARVSAGGAIFSSLENCVLVDNWCNESGSYVPAAMHCTSRNCTVVGNRLVGSLAGGRCVVYGCTLYNTIIWNNPCGGIGTGCSASNCMTTDPTFRDEANRDYRLKKSSSCIDAGNNSYSTIDADLAGKARIYNGTVDIGAYEYQPAVLGGIGNIFAKQRYPWNGLVDITVTLSGAENDVANAEWSFVATNKATKTEIPIARLTRNGEPSGSGTSWTQKFIWNASNDVPGDMVADIELSVEAKTDMGGVQLWANGLYWAECNVGATKPEEYGYYFWWGDTVGYKRNANNDGWVSVKDGKAFSFSSYGNCPTSYKDNSALQSAGYIDSTGNLVAAHDAATAHLGAPWRMPTDAEFQALMDNCTTTWTTRNGVYGRLVTGKGAYASKSIFLPAAGDGVDSDLYYLGSCGFYWSSTPNSDYSAYAWNRDFDSGGFNRHYFFYRHLGQSVRPLRGFDAIGASTTFRLDLRGLGPWQRRTAVATEALTYSAVWTTNASAAAKAVVKVYPVLKEKPKYLVIDLSGGTNATQYPISYLNEIPDGLWSDEYKTSKLVLRHIPAGSFIMGGRNTDYPGAVNTNLHMVTISRDFYMGVFEVTQRQWELVMGNRPSQFTNETCYATRPVDKVSYLDIRGSVQGAAWPLESGCDETSFIGVLSAKSGLSGIDLPTDAQWEYACRAGTSTALNIGKNISTAQDVLVCPELMADARFTGNSNNSNMTNPERFACTDEYCSAKVGSYTPNNWGLYDMHGNLWELCLDRAAWLATGEVDPIGIDDESITKRIIRGGGYNELAWRCSSGFRYSDTAGMGYNQTGRGGTVGFRLCLQGGDVPDFAAASALVNAAGNGSQSWTPTKAGAYYLTHSTMNGATNVQLLSAWFEVPGPRLVFTPQGELTNGVTVAIDGAEDGWTIRYTTDGSAPTADSPVYRGPFSLPASCTVRAVAYNEQGMASEDFSETFTLHDALGIVGAVARPRYPWNGKVDIDVELNGDPAKTYLVELTAKDLDGGTNLPVKTVSCAGASTTYCVPPGRHRFTWDADADIQTDGEFPRVAVSVSATGSALVGYARQMALTVDGYTGAETLTNVPVLVRLSTTISGFDYNDFAIPSNGADLAFFDANERRLAYEIDEWHTNGTSLVWVKLPELKRGTTFTAAWGRSGDGSAVGSGQDRERAKNEVWREYAGVWHMNEDSGTAYDSTEHHLDGIPSCGTNELADISQMVAYENGACGRARVNLTIVPTSDNRWMDNGTFMLIPSYDGLGLVDCFVASIWINGTVPRNYPRIFSRKNANEDEGGFELSINDEGTCDIRGGSSACTDRFALPPYSNDWAQIVLTMSGDVVNCYTNGTLSGTSSGVITASGDNGLCLGIGSKPNGNSVGYLGQYDEIRLRGGSLSADRIKADYDMIKNREFLIYGSVKSGMGAAE